MIKAKPDNSLTRFDVLRRTVKGKKKWKRHKHRYIYGTLKEHESGTLWSLVEAKDAEIQRCQKIADEWADKCEGLRDEIQRLQNKLKNYDYDSEEVAKAALKGLRHPDEILHIKLLEKDREIQELQEALSKKKADFSADTDMIQDLREQVEELAKLREEVRRLHDGHMVLENIELEKQISTLQSEVEKYKSGNLAFGAIIKEKEKENSSLRQALKECGEAFGRIERFALEKETAPGNCRKIALEALSLPIVKKVMDEKET